MTWWQILLIILAVILVLLVVLYFVGTKLQKRQAASEEQMEAMKQTVSLLVIDKKKMKMKEANLPAIVQQQTPKYMQRMKMPFVKVKVGPQVMTMIADPKVFEIIPVKKECKVVISGIYITDLLSVRGGSVPKLPEKKGILSRFRKQKPAAPASAEKAKPAAQKTNSAQSSAINKINQNKANKRKK